MTCQLIKEGVFPSLAIKIQKIAAEIYRGVRICNQREEYIRQMSEALSTFGTKENPNIENEIVKQILKRIKQNELLSLGSIVSTGFGISVFGSSDKNEQVIRIKVRNFLNKYRAAVLYKENYVGCTSTTFAKPFLVKDDNKPRQIARDCSSLVAKEDCDRAKKVLATWDMDFAWTVAQHEIGAKFAAEKCQKSKEPESQKYCPALKKYDQDSSSNSSMSSEQNSSSVKGTK
jgi:hypothetical protein